MVPNSAHRRGIGPKRGPVWAHVFLLAFATTSATTAHAQHVSARGIAHPSSTAHSAPSFVLPNHHSHHVLSTHHHQISALPQQQPHQLLSSASLPISTFSSPFSSNSESSNPPSQLASSFKPTFLLDSSNFSTTTLNNGWIPSKYLTITKSAAMTQDEAGNVIKAMPPASTSSNHQRSPKVLSVASEANLLDTSSAVSLANGNSKL